jgi:hypothetical protein
MLSRNAGAHGALVRMSTQKPTAPPIDDDGETPPPAGPHDRPGLTDPEAAPGSGMLPDPEDPDAGNMQPSS